MIEVQLGYEKLLTLRRRLGVRLYEKATGDGVRIMCQDGAFVLYADLVAGSDEHTQYVAAIQARAGAPIPMELHRAPTHDLAMPWKWFGDTLPDGHADKMPTAFVARSGSGKAQPVLGEDGKPTNYVAATVTYPRGYFTKLDATPFDAGDATTFWEPRSNWRLAAPAGREIVIASGEVEVNANAAIDPASSVGFQLYTYVDPVIGQPAAPDATFSYNATKGQPAWPGTVDEGDVVVQAPVPLVAPPEGLWLYKSIDDLRGFANDKNQDPAELAAETGKGFRIGLSFSYLVAAGDDEAREAVIDGRFGQFVEITTQGHLPVTNAARAVATFHYYVRDIF